MTAFHITLIIVVLFIILFFIVFKYGLPYDIEEWMEGIALIVALETLIVTICIFVGAIIYKLCYIDWYGFFHDKLFYLW